MNKTGELRAASCVDLEPDDYVEFALDASCAALMALDRVRMLSPEDERITGRISLAIAALRHAIADLREQQEAGCGVAKHGFGCGGRGDEASDEGEVKPPPSFHALP